MGDAISALLAIVVLACTAGGVALAVQRGRDRRARAAARARRAARWVAGEQGRLDRTEVFVHKVAADGEEVDRVKVAEIPDGAPDWDALMMDARAKAANRAAVLNTTP